ncbi:hypothetical protein CVIRNUC_010406 [Coccomyxa viridis]|uniref:VOC domain-containing protein n=1 Tax=Coccomyxa viridis TaxID=1274662 RepID=A0AAV1IM87_9CHLO|nr:hypothetical protein CVIRNUC_010406 [Coccomyxa viridis]
MAQSRSSEAVDKLLDIASQGGQGIGSAEDRAEDVGGIIHYEHIQLYMPDLHKAYIFYCDGLGFTQDPGTWSKQRGGFKVLWFNLGRHQMHIVQKDVHQDTKGYITVVVRSLELVKKHLQEVEEALDGTQFRCQPKSVGGEEKLFVTDPWGQEFMVLQGGKAGDFPISMGMSEVQLPVHAGTSHAIADFYKEIFHARVEAPTAGESVVYVGPGTKFRFTENQALGPVTNKKFTEIFDGWHAAIYVSDFSGAFRAMEAADLIFTEHGFFDANIDGLRDAQKFHQFRFQDIIALKDLDGDGWSVKKGDVIYQFGNEVRSLCHPKFMRALYNRNGDNFDVPEEVQTIV